MHVPSAIPRVKQFRGSNWRMRKYRLKEIRLAPGQSRVTLVREIGVGQFQRDNKVVVVGVVVRR